MLGEMLAAGLNANLGGRDHMPIEVERQILRGCRAPVSSLAPLPSLQMPATVTPRFISDNLTTVNMLTRASLP